MNFDILIVGAGHAGAQAAIALRQLKYPGSIAIVGDEPELPYERPPLSKEYLAGEKPFERLLLRPEKFWAERDIQMLRSTRIVSVDASRKVAMADTGRALGYSHMIWAAGASPRKLELPGFDLEGIHYVRNKADVVAIMRDLPEVKEIVIVGGGYIGLEAAAVLKKLGKIVTVIEASDRVLARVAGEPLSRFYEREHKAQGVDIRLSQNIREACGKDGRVHGLRMSDGSEILAQMIIVGIGVEPSVEALLEAGASGDPGVDVDEYCQTTVSDIYAIGDCATHRNAYADSKWIRLESVQNANDQAKVVAQRICGNPVSYDAVPWFWSNQYDLKLQTVGISSHHDDLVIRGDQATRSFSVVYLHKGRVIALDCVNAVKDYVQGRKLVEQGCVAAKELLMHSPTLKELVG
jgi:3-phenylpropionate/trans-cinnamate dioxygenase ferredoxin reductase subunit